MRGLQLYLSIAYGEELAESAEKAGLSREYIRLLEAGLYDPTVGTLQKIAKALGVPLAELLR